jgi:hypothetical protein
MKKILVFCLTVVMLLNIGMVAFAAPNGFMGSPEAKPAPTLISVKLPDGCDGELIITPFSEKNTLPEDLIKLMDKAYGEIVASNDLSKLNADLAKRAKSMKIEGKNLLVSELFDIRVEGCTVHKDHHDLEIVLSAEALKYFVGLLHMRAGDAEWELIKNAKVIKDGTHLAFTVDTLSPFAVVVNKDKTSPQTQDNSVYVYLMVLCAGALAAATLLKGKKA